MAGINDDSLDDLAELITNLKPVQKKKLEMLLNAKARGIKKSRKVSKLGLGDYELVMGEQEENTRLDKDGSIIHEQSDSTELFDCGHSGGKEFFGHIADGCGHTVCKPCVSAFNLICAYPGCFVKLCPRPGCSHFFQEFDGALVCRKHIGAVRRNRFFLRLFGNKE
ncbi:hypothetical protein JXA85_04345 [Candidatus Woesearchaeota archaeon]|nr:hypothetical protein [Candidatus Woesearchaeota archaeon]